MRLGLNWGRRDTRGHLEDRLATINELGVGSVAPPREMVEWPIERCRACGETVTGPRVDDW